MLNLQASLSRKLKPHRRLMIHLFEPGLGAYVDPKTLIFVVGASALGHTKSMAI